MKKKHQALKGKDYKDIIAGVDNKWEMIAAIWLCKNKEAKNLLISFFLAVIVIILIKPEIAVYINNLVGGYFK